MSEASLQADGGHRWVISGRLDFDTVPRLWSQLAGQLGGAECVLDLGGVSGANSAGLALLLEAHAEAHRHGGCLRVQGLPDSLSQLAAISGLTPLLDELRG